MRDSSSKWGLLLDSITRRTQLFLSIQDGLLESFRILEEPHILALNNNPEFYQLQVQRRGRQLLPPTYHSIPFVVAALLENQDILGGAFVHGVDVEDGLQRDPPYKKWSRNHPVFTAEWWDEPVFRL